MAAGAGFEKPLGTRVANVLRYSCIAQTLQPRVSETLIAGTNSFSNKAGRSFLKLTRCIALGRPFSYTRLSNLRKGIHCKTDSLFGIIWISLDFFLTCNVRT